MEDNNKTNSVVGFDYDVDDEFDNETDLCVDVSRFGEAVIWGTDWTTETIARQLEKGAIDLAPSFQRRDAWSNQEKSKLIESLMLGLPVPPIILAENKGKKNAYIVIDGKQRLLSIRRFFAKEDSEEEFKSLKLSGLEILTELNGQSYNKLREEHNEYIDNLENQPIRTIVIKNWPDEAFLYTVFLRLNTGSKKLSPQELRQALIPGPFLTYLDTKTADSLPIQKMLGNTAPDPRMKDVELALRYYGFKCYLEKHDGNLKKFMDDTCRTINKDWDSNVEWVEALFGQLEEAITFSADIMESRSPFSRYENGSFNNRFNKNIYELFTFYFSDSNIRKLVVEDRENFLELFKTMNEDEKFLAAVNGTTKDIKKVSDRFDMFWSLLSKLNGAERYDAERVKLIDNRLVVSREKLG